LDWDVDAGVELVFKEVVAVAVVEVEVEGEVNIAV
jgi:hypothetical protein